MRYKASYVIRGKAELVSRIFERQASHIDYIAGPFLWTNEQGGRTAYTNDDYAEGVKRLFLAHLKHVSLQPEDVGTLFGELPIEHSFFDDWWTVEVFQGVDEDAANVVEQLRRAGQFETLRQVGLPIVGVISPKQ